MVIRLSRSSVGEEEKQALAGVIDDGYLGMGGEVQRFEAELAEYLGGERHVISASTGTAALHLAVAALDIEPGDEILLPTITYVASFQAVRAAGGTPVACDVRSKDLYLDVSDAEKRLTSRTKAVMPVHYASGTKGLAEVYAFATANGLRVIEDAAHSFGGDYGGQKVGATGDVVCFSFDGIKNITCGEGGAIVTGDEKVATRVRDARLLGVERDTDARFSAKRSWTFDVHRQGYRYHMSNLNAAIGRAQLKKVGRFSSRRRALAARYREALDELNALALLDLDWDQIVPHIFVVRVLDGSRDALVASLKGYGIETGFHYQPNHRLTLFADGGSRVAADELAREIVTLPLHAQLTDAEQDVVITAIKRFFQAD
jgi:dTDP-4-amino-4,6-dideoxygalactose transaminase